MVRPIVSATLLALLTLGALALTIFINISGTSLTTSTIVALIVGGLSTTTVGLILVFYTNRARELRRVSEARRLYRELDRVKLEVDKLQTVINESEMSRSTDVHGPIEDIAEEGLLAAESSLREAREKLQQRQRYRKDAD